MAGRVLKARARQLECFGWPGVHSASSLTEEEYNARQRGEAFHRSDHAEELEVRLDPLPGWQYLSDVEHRRWVEELVQKIEQDALAMHRRKGTAPLRATAVI